ncbi:tyrosine-type recombinase/integrase [Caminibacter sp.]
MTIREIRKLSWNGKNEFVKVAENLYVEVTKNKKVFKVLFKKEGKQIKATLNDVDKITLTEAKQKVLTLRGKIQAKGFAEAREIIRSELGKRQSKKDKEIIQVKVKESEKYLLKNIIQEYLITEDKKDQGRIKNYIIPALGELDVRKMGHTDIISKLIKNIYNLNKDNKKANTTTDKVETARELMRLLRNFYQFLFLHHNVTNNPTSFIDKSVIEQILGKHKVQHFKGITDIEELRTLYLKILQLPTYEESGNYNDIRLATKNLMRFMILTALRIGTARHLTWDMIDWDKKVINIPSDFTKTKIDFRLPLTNETLKVLEELKKYDKRQKGFIFKSRNGTPITESSVNKHLKKLSNNKTTSHGFRTSLSTILKENGFDEYATEVQLMHRPENAVAKIYTRTDFVERRRILLEKWENLLTTKTQKKSDGLIRFDF